MDFLVKNFGLSSQQLELQFKNIEMTMAKQP
jgi:hypothetical protein